MNGLHSVTGTSAALCLRPRSGNITSRIEKKMELIRNGTLWSLAFLLVCTVSLCSSAPPSNKDDGNIRLLAIDWLTDFYAQEPPKEKDYEVGLAVSINFLLAAKHINE